MVRTDAHGVAATTLIVGTRAEVASDVVIASAAGFGGGVTHLVTATQALEPEPRRVGWSASAFPLGPVEATSIAGSALDDTNQPLAGVSIHVTGTELATETNEDGVFVLEGAPVGTLYLDVDGSTSPREGPWPHLMFRMVP